jgi:hypothetical protein
MIRFLTYGGGDISRFEYLKTSSENCGLPMNFISNKEWNGYFDKVLFVHNAIKNIPDNDIVCFVDGFDVIAIGDSDEIREKFLKFDCDVLFGAELNCWPGDYLGHYNNIKHDTGFRFVNSGGFIGYKHAIMKIYTWKTIEDIEVICKNQSDQGYFIEYYLAHVNNIDNRIKLDTRAEIFQNMFSFDWNELHFENGRFINLVMNTKPCFLHFNGESWKTSQGENIMPIIINKLKSSKDNKAEIMSLSEYRQNFNEWYFKRNQL